MSNEWERRKLLSESKIYVKSFLVYTKLDNMNAIVCILRAAAAAGFTIVRNQQWKWHKKLKIGKSFNDKNTWNDIKIYTCDKKMKWKISV